MTNHSQIWQKPKIWIDYVKYSIQSQRRWIKDVNFVFVHHVLPMNAIDKVGGQLNRMNQVVKIAVQEKNVIRDLGNVSKLWCLAKRCISAKKEIFFEE